jgi:putative membrane protein
MRLAKRSKRNFSLLGVMAALGLVLVTQGAVEGNAKRPPFAQVLTTVHKTNLAEIELGNLAKERGMSPRVRAFGDRLVRDHQLADRMLLAAADHMKVALLPDEAIAPHEKKRGEKHRSLLSDLRLAAADDFDSLFLHSLKLHHEEALNTYTDAIGNLPVTYARELIVRLRPILSQHLELATQLLKKEI